MILRLFNKNLQEPEIIYHVTYFEECSDNYYIEFKDHKSSMDSKRLDKDNFSFTHIKEDES